jgi:hypothetical protein
VDGVDCVSRKSLEPYREEEIDAAVLRHHK